MRSKIYALAAIIAFTAMGLSPSIAKDFPPHPGTVRMVDMYDKTARDVPVADVPAFKQFVYLKNGVETSNPQEATARIPIVEVRMMPLDANGNLIAKDKATTIVIHELGPGGRSLRRTTMRRN